MHKSLAGLGLALVVWSAACGGSSKPTTTPQPDVAPKVSACAQAAAHTKELLLEVGKQEQEDTAVLEKVAPVIERVIRERCETDAWDAAVVACVNEADEKGMDGCVERLSETQQKAVEDQLDRELDPIMEEERKQKGMNGGEAPTGAPAPGSPAPPPPPDDPCGGGA